MKSNIGNTTFARCALTALRAILFCTPLFFSGGCRWWWNPPAEPNTTFAGTPPPSLRPTPPSDLVVSRLTLTPKELMAPVGAEIPLVCSLCEDGYVPSNQRIDWQLTAESVGEFTAASLEGENNLFAPLDFQPQLSARQVVGVTSSREVALRSGTSPVQVRPGQAYVVLRSAQEGTSVVIVSASPGGVPAPEPAGATPTPQIAGGTPAPQAIRLDSNRQQTAVIHWLDAQWVLPASAVEPSGTSHRLTTLVRRQTDGAPKPGWLVKYEIAGGSAAGFAPDMAQSAEVSTDAEGKATVELLQRQAARGTTQIRVQVVRPAELGAQPLVVGEGTMQVSWTADVGLRVGAPQQASVGQDVLYRVEVANPTQLALRNVVVDLTYPAGLTLVDSDPSAKASDPVRRALQWELRELAAGTRTTLDATFKAEKAGPATVCADLRTAEGLTAKQCATTNVGMPKIEIRMTAPKDVELNQKAQFNIQVTNLGPGAAAGLQLRAFFDAGLKHAAGPEIFYDLGTMEEGDAKPLQLNFTVVAPKGLCNRVEVHGPSGILASAEACATTKPTPATPPLDTNPPDKKPGLSVIHTGPLKAVTGDEVTFVTRIRNTGQVPLTSLVVVNSLSESLKPLEASPNHAYQFATGHELSWKYNELEVGKSIQVEVRCRCQDAGRFCSTVAVAAAQASETAEACVDVAMPDAALALDVSDNTDPVLEGREVIYRVKVGNPGKSSQRNVLVEAALPDGTTLMLVGTGAMGFTFSQDNRKLKFSPIAELKPGASQEFRVVLRADQAGRITLKATARSDVTTVPARAEAGTDVNPVK